MNSKLNFAVLFVLLYAGQLIAEPRPEPKYDDKDYIEEDDDDEYDFVDDATNEAAIHPKYYIGRDVNGGSKDESGKTSAKKHIAVSDIVAQTGINPATAYVPLNDGHGTTYLVPSASVKLFTGENILFPVDKGEIGENEKGRSAPRNNVRPGQRRRTNRRQTALQKQRLLQQQQKPPGAPKALRRISLFDLNQLGLRRQSFRRRFRVGGPRKKNRNRNRNRNRKRRGNQRWNANQRWKGNRRRNGNRRRGNRRRGTNRRRIIYI